MTPDPKDPTSKVLLNAATADTTGETLDTPGAKQITIFTTSSGVSTGATRTIEVKDPATGSWHTVDSLVSTDAAFNEPVLYVGRAAAVRASISGYSDGTYTVSAGYL
jgi:hypothetical protein